MAWQSVVSKAFMYAAMIAFLIGFFTTSTTSYGSFVAGYSVLILGILVMLVTMFAETFRVNPYSSLFHTMSLIAMTSGPFLIMLGVISFVLYLLIKYQSNIVDGHIAPGFNTFSNIVAILLMVQLFLIQNNNGTTNRVTISILYLLNVFAAISAIVLYTIVKYYSTDGFTLN